MKGNISRDSHRPEDRYSAVFQVQGGMVTDADLGEQARIARRRTDGLGRDAAGSGVPAEGGAVSLGGGGPQLVEGVVYAEGVRGETRATGALAGPLSLLGRQVDLPLAPPMPATGAFILYADLWERVVTNLEDPNLSDPGLHGAETGFRTRTMAQIKTAPAAQEALLGRPDGPFPRIGGGVLTVTPADPETIADECDPCADTVSAEQTVANALFRIEVVHVHGDQQAPERITLAWSAENASAIAPASVNAEDFGRAGAVYEFFSTATECHPGAHADPAAAARSSFAVSLAAGPEAPSAPGGGDWPFVRRWDGAVAIDFAAGTAERAGGGAGVSVSGRTATLAVDAFTAQIAFGGRPTLAGDYWLIEMRRFAEPRVRAVQETPIGIRHSYCPLFRVSDGAVQPLTDAERRRLSFPALADLPATHVALDNNCAKLFGDAGNVQEALDNLCAIEAADIAFDPEGCPRLYDGADNVQAALDNLCKVDFGTERLLRLLHDWGVVCGVVPERGSRGPSTVRWSGGAILDRAGVLGDVEETVLELDKLIGTERFHFDGFPAFADALRKKEACLALAIGEGGRIEAHLARRSRAFGPADPTFLSVFAACRAQKPTFDIKEDLAARPSNERVALDKMFYGAAYSKLAASQRLSGAEQRVARSYNDDLLRRYKVHLDDEDEALRLDAKIREIDERIQPGAATGEVRETRFLEREAAVYRLVRETEEERIRRCLCGALMPRCPTPGEAPHLVPIACLEGTTEGERILIDRVCPWCCRKQAMSWRMVQYFAAELRDQFADRIEAACCPPERSSGTVKPRPTVSMTHLEAQLKPTGVWQEAERGFRILQGRTPPAEYTVQPRIEDLGVDQARRALDGNGVEVTQTIDVADVAAIAKLREASVGLEARDLLGDTGAVAPGDKVALIVQNGIAIDYVKLETGAGKFTFDRAATASAGLSEEARKDFETATRALDDRIAAAESVEAGFAALIETRREAVARETAEAEQSLQRLRAEQADLGAAVETMRSSMAEIEAERRTMTAALAEARTEFARLADEQKSVLAGAAQEQDAMIAVIRRETPVTAVVAAEPALANALAARGVTNVAGLAELSDADLTAVAREAGTNLNTARRMKREAADRLVGPVR